MSNVPFSGHCLCGGIHYTVSKPPNWCGCCHCSDCRRQVASVVATFLGCAKDAFEVTSGQLKHYQSSPGVTRSFCGDCGTPMAYESEQIPGEIHILHGTLDDPAAFEAQVQVFCKEKLPWLQFEVNGPAFDGLPQS